MLNGGFLKDLGNRQSISPLFRNVLCTAIAHMKSEIKIAKCHHFKHFQPSFVKNSPKIFWGYLNPKKHTPKPPTRSNRTTAEYLYTYFRSILTIDDGTLPHWFMRRKPPSTNHGTWSRRAEHSARPWHKENPWPSQDTKPVSRQVCRVDSKVFVCYFPQITPDMCCSKRMEEGKKYSKLLKGFATPTSPPSHPQ